MKELEKFGFRHAPKHDLSLGLFDQVAFLRKNVGISYALDLRDSYIYGNVFMVRRRKPNLGVDSGFDDTVFTYLSKYEDFSMSDHKKDFERFPLSDDNFEEWARNELRFSLNVILKYGANFLADRRDTFSR